MSKQTENPGDLSHGSVKKRVREQRNFQVFLQPDEWQRFVEVFERAKSRYEAFGIDLKFTQAHVVRRIVGLDSPSQFVTQQDIDYFLHNTPIEGEIISELPAASPDVSESDTYSGQDTQKKKVANGD